MNWPEAIVVSTLLICLAAPEIVKEWKGRK